MEIYKHPSRFKVVSGGRRFGKTMLGAMNHIKLASDNKNSWWIAPSYPDGDIVWRALTHIANQIPHVKKNESKHMLYINNGWVQVRSADSEAGLRGAGLDYVTVDEAAHIRGLKDIWEQELRPALADRKGGAMFISTPKGFNDFYDLYKNAETDPEWHSWQVPTWDNPYIDKAEIEVLRRTLPALVFRQEICAEFVQLAGAMFKREYFEVVDSLPAGITDTVRFWDLAASKKTMADYTAGGKVGIDKDGNVYIIDMIRARYEWPELLRVFKAVAVQDGDNVRHGVETAGTQKGFLDMLLAEPTLAGVSISGYNPTTDKVTRAQPLLARAEQGKVKLLRGAWNHDFLDEACGFPEVLHDDQVDAVTGALTMLSTVDYHGAPIMVIGKER